jgi:hypothetical protein
MDDDNGKIDDFTNYKRTEDLFHSCELASVGVEMKRFSSTACLARQNMLDFLCMVLFSRLVVTSCKDLYGFCCGLGIHVALVKWSRSGHIDYLVSNLTETQLIGFKPSSFLEILARNPSSQGFLEDSF